MIYLPKKIYVCDKWFKNWKLVKLIGEVKVKQPNHKV